MNLKYYFNTKKIIWMFAFLIGVVFMVLQSWSTIKTFISFQTTLAISKETSTTLPPPTVVLCQEQKWRNGHFGFLNKDEDNISDKDWVLKQFYRLNDKMNISILWPFEIELTIGNNSVSQNGFKFQFMVKEILNPWIGLCYAMIFPQSNTAGMGRNHYLMVKMGFPQEMKKPLISAYLISPEDWYGMMLDNFGAMKPFKISLTELQTLTGIYIQQRKYFHIQDSFYLPSSMTTCKNYSGEDSYMKCQVQKNVDHFEILANATNSGCSCIPNSTYKSFFEIHPTSLEWEECKNNSEHAKCSAIMAFMDLDYIASKCPIPCKKVDYTGDIFGYNGYHNFVNPNEIGITISFNTMDTEIYNEILTFDLPTFVGTAGGSLGLFIGFSFTGFVWQVLDFFMRD